MEIDKFEVLYINTPSGEHVPTVEIWKNPQSEVKSAGAHKSEHWQVNMTRVMMITSPGLSEPGVEPVDDDGYTWAGEAHGDWIGQGRRPDRQSKTDPRLVTVVALLAAAVAGLLTGWLFLK